MSSKKKSQSDIKQKTLFDFSTFATLKGIDNNNRSNPSTIKKHTYEEMSKTKSSIILQESIPAIINNAIIGNHINRKNIIEDASEQDDINLPIYKPKRYDSIVTPSFNHPIMLHHQAQVNTPKKLPTKTIPLQSYALDSLLKDSSNQPRLSEINIKKNYPTLINQSEAQNTNEVHNHVNLYDEENNNDNNNYKDDDDAYSEHSTPIQNTKKKQNKRNKCQTSIPKKNRNKSANQSFDGSDDNLSMISNEEGLEMSELFANPQNGLPPFLQSANIKDKNGNTPNDPDYDPSTLFIPKAYYDKETPSMKQYWDFKRDNFDTVLLLKLGKFYELFYDDAIVGNHVLELNFMGNDPRKLHAGFPEKILHAKADALIEAGYQVAVVEQIETPDELKERNKNLKKKEHCVQRELCNVFTRGTYFKNEGTNNANPKNQYCLSLYYYQRKRQNQSQEPTQISYDATQNNFDFFSSDNQSNNSTQIEWGITLFDVTTLDFYLGIITEDENMDGATRSAIDAFPNLKTFLYNLSPDEIIIQRNNVPMQVINFLHSLSTKPQLTTLRNEYQLSTLNILATKYYGSDFEAWDNVILSTITNEENNRPSCISLYMTMVYLEKILLAKQCLPTATYHFYQANTILNPKRRLVLDYQSITNLEVTETKLNPTNPEAGSLMEYMNKAVTPFGKRLMKNWILNPLNDITMINERLDMIEDFMNNDELLASFRNSLVKWPDLERQCTKFYKLAMNNNSQAKYFEDVEKRRLNEFFNLLTFLIKSVKLFDMFKDYIKNNQIKSSLKNKLIIGDNEGNLPNIKFLLEEINNNFHIIESKDDKGNLITTIESKEGICPIYDEHRNKLNQIKERFDDILLQERKRLKCAIINYSHTKNFQYQLEIPEDYVKNNRPKEYILTTTKKGYQRFHTKEILDTVKELVETTELLKQTSQRLNIALFKDFYSKNKLINDYINIIAELDCIASLAFISSLGTEINKTACRPIFIPLEQNNNLPYLEIRDCRHPCLCSRVSYFVPNDIVIGSKEKTLIIITGPNMGGKSTLLREACVAIIMAQVGCYVPASKCIMTLVDRIFTRIGARDMLLEGKSTFYIEMEETKNILQNATINSMVIMDELGRGTSTHDGKIIAKTIIDRLEKGIKCRTLFTTHYHDIIDWCGIQPGIDLFFMDCNVNLETKDILFKYLFQRGICPESYGISVAKLAGLPSSIISMANKVSKINRKKNHA